MPLAVEQASEASLPNKLNLRPGTKVEAISAVYQLSISGHTLLQLRRLGRGSVLAGIEAAIEDFIATNGGQPIHSISDTLAAHVQAYETGATYP